MEFKFGKGLKITSRDSSHQLKFTARIQNRYDGRIQLSEGSKYENTFFVRRARLKFDGFVFKPEVVYKIEIDVVSGQMLDAVIKWNFYKGFTLWFGQTKLPGNRERLISSQKLQLVDRSLFNAAFTLDRDKGIQLHHQHSIGKVVIREIISIAMGEGKNYVSFERGNEYTGKIEVLPLGKFEGKGDYVGGAAYREQTPKLAIAGAFDFNHNCMRQRGTLGSFLDEPKDLKTFFADLMFKFKGLSIMSEFAHRTTLSSPVVKSEDTEEFQSYYTGWGLNAQTGYWFKRNWEIAGRVTYVEPETQTGFAILRQYTFALSKYIVGHSLKVQTDFSYSEEGSEDPKLIFRLQVELSF